MWGELVRQHGTALGGAVATAAAFAYASARGLLWIARGVRRRRRELRLRPRPRLRFDQSGAAMAEFVIAVGPFLAIWFGLMQLAICSFARLLVSHAAFVAARAAIVVLPTVTEPAPGRVERAGQLGGGDDDPADYAGSLKLARVRNAALYALIPAAPAVDTLAASAAATPAFVGAAERATDDALTGPLARFRAPVAAALAGAATRRRSIGATLEGALAGDALDRSVRKLVATRLLTAVTLHDDAGRLRSSFAWDEHVTARVTFLMPCTIPIAGWLAGRPAAAIDPAAASALAAGGLGDVDASALPGRYMVLSAEHTALLQGRPR
jgi:TadE-like protein